MKYMGSKRSIAKYIIPEMIRERKNRPWVEPFVGGANLIDKIDGKRIGNDINKYVISLLKAVQSGWIPPDEVTREMYYEIKSNVENYDPELVAFVGFLCSFGAKWWGGYAHNNSKKNYALEAKNSLMKQRKNIEDVDFICGDYKNMDIPPNSLIYCDPPYKHTQKYPNGEFNHDLFYQWCRDRVREGHRVFISEYSMPEDFKCIKTLECVTLLNKNKRQTKVEKLFTYY